MTRRNAARWSAAAVMSALVAAAPAAAQVGYPPTESPYRDISVRHEATLFGGYLDTQRDAEGVAPRGGPLLGARYELHLGGPAFLVTRLGASQTRRTVIDPTKPEAERVVGEESGPLGLVDVGLALSLTGPRSYRQLVPVIGAGAGIVTDFRGRPDVGNFRFGTRFALNGGAGVRWVPGGRLQVRADVTDYLYRITYPDSYYIPAPDNTVVRRDREDRSVWTHNVALTLGVSYLVLR